MCHDGPKVHVTKCNFRPYYELHIAFSYWDSDNKEVDKHFDVKSKILFGQICCFCPLGTKRLISSVALHSITDTTLVFY